MSQDQNYEYKIVEKHDDPRKAVIEKTGVSSAQFTLEDVERQQLRWSEEKREFEGKRMVEQAKADNVAHHHPFVLKLTEEEQYAVWLYYEAMKTATEFGKQVDMRVKALDEYQTEKEHIMDVLGYEKTDTPSTPAV